MLYHASQTPNIAVLEPRVSNHGVPLVYLSRKRENVLVYLSNAIEKYCRETGFAYDGVWRKWGPYGFDRDGILRLEEYYPNATVETYRGVSGYIYSAEAVAAPGADTGIPDAFTSALPVPVTACEFVPDAYEAILAAERAGLLRIVRYENAPLRLKEWSLETIRKEYREAAEHPEYRHFIRGKWGDAVSDL